MIIMPVRALIILPLRKHPMWMVQVGAIKCLKPRLHSGKNISHFIRATPFFSPTCENLYIKKKVLFFLKKEILPFFSDVLTNLELCCINSCSGAAPPVDFTFSLSKLCVFYKYIYIYWSSFLSSFPGIVCVENVPGTLLGVLSSGRLFPKAVRRSAGVTGNRGYEDLMTWKVSSLILISLFCYLLFTPLHLCVLQMKDDWSCDADI